MLLKTLILLLSLAFSINQTFAIGNVQLKNISIERLTKDKVRVQFDISASHVKTNFRCVVTPFLGDMVLPEVVFVGRNRSIVDLRERSRSRNVFSGNEKTYVLSGRDAKRSFYHYNVELIDNGKLSNVVFGIQSRTVGYCGKVREQSIRLPYTQLPEKSYVPFYNKEMLLPNIEEFNCLEQLAPYVHNVKSFVVDSMNLMRQREKGALAVYFKQSSADIDLMYADNASTFNEVKRVVDIIQADTCAKLQRLVIAGTASPEGDTEFNKKLATQRLEAIRRFCSTFINPNAVDLVSQGEDWEGLVQMISDSRMPYKELTIAIINQYSVEAGRKEQLKKLNNGATYNYMLRNFYPKLRCAAYLHILYEYVPNPDIGLINQIVTLVNNKNYSAALDKIEQIKKPSARSYNLEGVCYMMLKGLEKAKCCFERALALGDQNAAVNLNQLPVYILFNHQKFKQK